LRNQITEKANNINIKVNQNKENNFPRSQGAKSLKSLQKLNNCSMSDILSHSMIDLHEDKNNDKTCFNRVSSAPKLDSARDRLLSKENEITKSRYNTVQNDNEANLNQIILNDDFDIDVYTKNMNDNLHDINHIQTGSFRRVQSCENIIKPNLNENPFIDNEIFSISKNSTASQAESKKIMPIPASNHEDIEVLKKSLVMQRISKRDKLTSMASQSYSDLKVLDRNINEKNKLQDKNQSQEFFFHKEIRDAKVEKVKHKNEIKDKIIESFIENQIFSSDHKPKTSNYFAKLKE
jgi:hypothetical protein